MQILGDLIRLPEDGRSLPLPWWQRAPLGLLNNTNVWVGLVQSSRPVGDIVVSTLDINKWDNILRVHCIHDDETGVIADLMDAVFPLNVALAETVTTETGKEHIATMFCEDMGDEKVRNDIPRIREILRQKQFREIRLEPYLSPTRLPILKSCQTLVDHGLLKDVDYLAWILQQYSEKTTQGVDLTQAVVSADTANRILRFVFPNRGAATVRITHSDRPGALREIFSQFASCKLNVLSALLRRGGQKPRYAELLAVCEPLPEENPDAVFVRLRERINSIDQQFDAVLRFSKGRGARTVLYLDDPQKNAFRGKRPVFFAEFIGKHAKNPIEISNAVLSTLTASNCWPLRATLEQSSELGQNVPLIERAEVGIILVITGEGVDEKEIQRTALRVTQRASYLQALGKSTAIVADLGFVEHLEPDGYLILPLPQSATETDLEALRAALRNWLARAAVS